MNKSLNSNTMNELSQQEMKEINGGLWPLLIPIGISFAVGMYIGYNDAARENNQTN